MKPTNLRYIAAAAALALAVPASAGPWTTSTNDFTGTTVHNTETGESFRAISERAGKKQAKVLNKLEKKKKKQSGNGLYDDSSRECSDPMSGALC